MAAQRKPAPIKYSGGKGTETYPYALPDYGYATRTPAQMKKVIVFLALRKLTRASAKALEDGEYFYARVTKWTRTYGSENYAVVRAYRDGNRIEIVKSRINPATIVFTLAEAKEFLKRTGPTIPKQR